MWRPLRRGHRSNREGASSTAGRGGRHDRRCHCGRFVAGGDRPGGRARPNNMVLVWNENAALVLSQAGTATPPKHYFEAVN